MKKNKDISITIVIPYEMFEALQDVFGYAAFVQAAEAANPYVPKTKKKRGGRPRTITRALGKEIVEMRTAGMRGNKIAEELGISKSVVYDYLAKHKPKKMALSGGA